jgi:hypothetical protein
MSELVCATVEPEDNYGVGVSTIWAEDVKCYETALLDRIGAYPVQRYKTKDEAALGHWAWIRKSREIKTVVQIGCDLYQEPDRIITLQRDVTMQ